MPCAAALALALALAASRNPVAAAPKGTPFDTCLRQQATTLSSYSSETLSTPGAWMTLYDLHDKRLCAGRVDHPFAMGTDALGWVPCGSPAQVRVRWNVGGTRYSVTGSSSSPTLVGCFGDSLRAVGQSPNLPVMAPPTIQSWTACKSWAHASSLALFSFQWDSQTCSGSNDLGLATREPGYASCNSMCSPDGSPESAPLVWCGSTSTASLAVYAIGNVTSLYPAPLPRQVFTNEFDPFTHFKGFVDPTTVVDGSSPSDVYGRLEIQGTGEIVMAQVFRGSITHDWDAQVHTNVHMGDGVQIECPSSMFGGIPTAYPGSRQWNTANQIYFYGHRTVNYNPQVIMAIVSSDRISTRNYYEPQPMIGYGTYYAYHPVNNPLRFLNPLYRPWGYNYAHEPNWLTDYSTPRDPNTAQVLWNPGTLSAPEGQSNEVFFSANMRVVTAPTAVTGAGGFRFVFHLGDDPVFGQHANVDIPRGLAPVHNRCFTCDAGHLSFAGTNVMSAQYGTISEGRAYCWRADYYIWSVDTQYVIPAPTARLRYTEFGTESTPPLGPGQMSPFLTNVVDSFATAAQSITKTDGRFSNSYIHHRFFGPLETCACQYNSTANLTSDGFCEDVDECSLSPAQAIAPVTCGLHSKCVNLYGSSTCDCTVGYAYDPIRLRVRRELADLNDDFTEKVHCQATSLVEVSNSAVRITPGIYDVEHVNFSAVLYNTKPGAIKDKSVVKWNVPFMLRNVSYTITDVPLTDTQRLIPHNTYSLELYVNNYTLLVFDQLITMSCGCGYDQASDKFVEFQRLPPRPDDGRPVFSSLVQRLGNIVATWVDDSKCDASYTHHRLTPNLDVFSQPNLAWNQWTNAAVRTQINAFSDDVTNLKLTPRQIAADFSMGKTKSSDCGLDLGPLAVDSVVDSPTDLAVGTRHFFCAFATGAEDGTSNYQSSYGCAPVLFAVKWETRIVMDVQAGMNALGPVDGVTLKWKAYLIPALTSSTDLALTISQVGVEVHSGQVVSGRAAASIYPGGVVEPTPNPGQAMIHLQLDAKDWPGLDSASRVVFSIVASKVDVIDNQTISHNFLCHSPFRECSARDPHLVMASHLSFDKIVAGFRDVTVVDVTGVVYASPGNTCPFTNKAKVCAYAAPGRDVASPVQFGCTDTNELGQFHLPVDFFSTAIVYVDYSPGQNFTNHTFAASGRFAGQGGSTITIHTTNQNVDGLDFVDTTNNTLFVDFLAGACGFALAQSASVTLTRPVGGIGGKCELNDVTLTRLTSTRFWAVVPAQTWSVVPFVGVTLDGVGGTAIGVNTYYHHWYTGDNEVSLDLSSIPVSKCSAFIASATAAGGGLNITVDAVNGTNSPAEGDFGSNATATTNTTTATSSCSAEPDYQTSRLLTFTYHVPPSSSIEIRQKSQRKDSRPQMCINAADLKYKADNHAAETRLLTADFHDTVDVVMNVWQDFPGGIRCDVVPGAGQIWNGLGPVDEDLCTDVDGCLVRGVLSPTNTTVVMLSGVRAPPTLRDKYVRWTFVGDFHLDVPPMVQRVWFFILGLIPPAPDEQFNVVHTVYNIQPLVVIRDPPGGASYSYFSGSTSTIRMNFDETQVLATSASSYTISTGIDLSAQMCSGPSTFFSMLFCLPILGVSRHVDVTPNGNTNVHSIQHHSTSNSVTVTVSWSASTSGSQAYPGPPSDLFLVLTLPTHYVMWVTVTGATACTPQSTSTPSVVTGKPELAFITRFEAQSRIRKALIDLGHTPDKDFAAEVPVWENLLNTAPQYASNGGRRVLLERNASVPVTGEGNQTRQVPVRVLTAVGGDFDLLAAGGDMWNSQIKVSDAQAVLKGLPPVVVFSGGGAGVHYSINEDDMVGDGGYQTSSTITNDWSWDMSYGVTVLATFGHRQVYSGSTTTTHESITGKSERKKTAAAGFYLADPHPGDSFQVLIRKDLTYGTFVFQTLGGYSMCPVEPNTVAREKFELTFVSQPTTASSPWDPQVFTLSLANTGVDVTDVKVWYDVHSAQNNDVAITVNGSPMLSSGIILESMDGHGTEFLLLVSIRKGSRTNIQNIAFGVRSACDDAFLGPGIPHDDPYRTPSSNLLVLQAKWFQTCPTLRLQTLLPGQVEEFPVVVVNAEAPVKSVQFVVQNADQVGLSLKDMHAQHLVDSASLEVLVSITDGWKSLIDPLTGSFVDLIARESNFTRYSEFTWMVDGQPQFKGKTTAVHVRAVVKCPVDKNNLDKTAGVSSSLTSTVLIDMEPPRVIAAGPRGVGVVPSTTAASFTFSESIKCDESAPIFAQVSIWRAGMEAAEPLVFVAPTSVDNPSVVLTCSGDTVVVSFLFAEVWGSSLRRYDLLGARVNVTLSGVKDLSGNRAVSTLITTQDKPVGGQVEVHYDVVPLDPATTWFEAPSLVVPTPVALSGSGAVVSFLRSMLGRHVDPTSVSVRKIDSTTYAPLALVCVVLRQSTTAPDADLMRTFTDLTLDDRSGMYFFGSVGLDVVPTSLLVETTTLQHQHRDILTALTAGTEAQLRELGLELSAKLDILIQGLNFTTSGPTSAPSQNPTTSQPTRAPSTSRPSRGPSLTPSTSEPSQSPSRVPSAAPSRAPSRTPSHAPSVLKPYEVSLCSFKAWDTPMCEVMVAPPGEPVANALDSSVTAPVRVMDNNNPSLTDSGTRQILNATEVVVAPWTVSTCNLPSPPARAVGLPTAQWSWTALSFIQVNTTQALQVMCGVHDRFPVWTTSVFQCTSTDLTFLSSVIATSFLAITENPNLETAAGLSNTLLSASNVQVFDNPRLKSFYLDAMELAPEVQSTVSLQLVPRLRSARFPAITRSRSDYMFIVGAGLAQRLGSFDLRSYVGPLAPPEDAPPVDTGGMDLWPFMVVFVDVPALERIRFDSLNVSDTVNVLGVVIDRSPVRLLRFMPYCPSGSTLLDTRSPTSHPSSSPSMHPRTNVPSSHPTTSTPTSFMPSSAPVLRTPTDAPVFHTSAHPSAHPSSHPLSSAPTSSPTKQMVFSFAEFKSKCVAPAHIPDHDYDNMCTEVLEVMCPDVGNSSQTWNGNSPCWLPHNSYTTLGVINTPDLRQLECAMDANHMFKVANVVLNNVTVKTGSLWDGLERVVLPIRTVSATKVNGLLVVNASQFSSTFTMSAGDMSVLRFTGTFAPTAVRVRWTSAASLVAVDVASLIQAQPPKAFTLQLYPTAKSQMAWEFPNCTGVMNLTQVMQFCSEPMGSTAVPTTKSPTTRAPTTRKPTTQPTTNTPTSNPVNASVNASFTNGGVGSSFAMVDSFVGGVVVGGLLGVLATAAVGLVVRKRTREARQARQARQARERDRQSVVLMGRQALGADNPMFQEGVMEVLERRVNRQNQTFEVVGGVAGSTDTAMTDTPSVTTSTHFTFGEGEVVGRRAGSVSERV